MESQLAKEYFNNIKKNNHGINESGLIQEYKDITVLVEIYNDIIKNKICGCDKMTFAKKGLRNDAIKLNEYERQIVTLLRCLYFVASTFITNLLYNCNYRSIDRDKNEQPVTLATIYSNKKIKINRAKDDIVDLFKFADKAFFVQVYRNIYIAHSNIPRDYYPISTGLDVTFRLQSTKLISSPVLIYPAKDNDINALIEKYKLKQYRNLETDPNICQFVDATSDLFYKVPLYINSIKNDDRDKIYEIIKYTACYSMSLYEVVNSIDALIVGLCS